MELISINSKEYRNIHDWVRREKKGDSCEFCGTSKGKIDNALKRGKNHEKNVDNYLKLCRKCHIEYDFPEGKTHSEETKKVIGKHSKIRIKNNGVPEAFINSRKGKSITEDHKKAISESMTVENHHQSKLTESDVLEIIKSNEKSSVIAKTYNVTYKTIYNIKSRKTWKHLDL